ncbi:MAG: DbpA RNA binding domain-containing protein, partial [Rhodospirillales bacterium]|nr:DbpA RNA binding domain-containing protein [Rhodospirillales bacterium]
SARPERSGGRQGERQGAEYRDEAKKPRRDDFVGGVWFSMSVGRKHTADPRWLLPMLCRAGHITKTDIGAIKIHQNETHVELSAASADKFLEAIGPSRKVEKTITVTRLQGVPETPRDDQGDEKSYDEPKTFAKRSTYDPIKAKPETKRKFADESGEAAPSDKPYKKPYAAKSDKPYKAHGDKPYKAQGDKPYKAKSDKPYKAKGDAPYKAKGEKSDSPYKPKGDKPYKAHGDKPYKDKGDKPYQGKGEKSYKPKGEAGKKPFKPKFAKAAPKAGGHAGAGVKSGSSPLKRKPLSLKPR